MSPLVALAVNLFPQLLRTISQNPKGDVAAAIARKVASTLGTDDPVEAEKILKDDPGKAAELRAELLQFELEHHRLDVETTRDARAMQRDLSARGSAASWAAPVLSAIVVAGFFLMLLVFVIFKNSLEVAPMPIPIEQLNQLEPAAIAALPRPSDFVIQIINILVGAMAAAFATVISFWLGSSSGSQAKDRVLADLQTSNTETANTVIEKAASAVNRGGPPPDAEPPASGGGRPGGGGGGPGVRPAPKGLFVEELPKLAAQHRHFPDSVAWALTAGGVSVEGAPAARTPGNPDTVADIWKRYGAFCSEAARTHGVPVELIVATIATESRGDPRARRDEPAVNDVSVGLMQTLVGTAREATGRSSLRADDLLDPRTSIDAGTAFLTAQRGATKFDPPLVAAAYNAGSIRKDEGPRNRWKLHCFPKGTGAHVDRFVDWFGDCMAVSRAMDWGKDGTPSFASALAAAAPVGGVVAGAAKGAGANGAGGFPSRPDFDPLVSTEARQKMFGAFEFKHAPKPDNREHIEIVGGWDRDNIVTVDIPLKGGARRMQFHRLGADQLKNLWLEWEEAGLLDRIESFDGAFVPRFQRGSTRTLSNHAFGTAFDINASTNGLNRAPAGTGEKGCLFELVSAANRHGFYWGGHFRSRLDGMHFEVARVV